MKIYHDFLDKALKPKPRAVAIGIFDGVHKGHQKILNQVLRESKRRGLTSAVVTFDPHPNKVLFPQSAHPIIMSLAHRLRFFEKLGIKETIIVHFNKKFSKLTHDRFLKKFLLDKLGTQSLTVGYDFCFGFKGKGTIDFLRAQSKIQGFNFSVVPALTLMGAKVISSTRIRQFIEKGRLKEAERMLGRPVSVYGTVVRGRGRGRKIGFPTANLNPHHETLPPAGVYAAWGFLDKQKLKGIIHIGKRPTFNDGEATLEVHFLNFKRAIYGREIELLFVGRLRSVKKFKTAAALSAAIKKDAQKALKLLA